MLSEVAWAVSDGMVAVGATGESSGAAGIDGDQSDNSVATSGAVYVFEEDDADNWHQAAYIKAPNPDVLDSFWCVRCVGR